MSLEVETPVEKHFYAGPTGDINYSFTLYNDDEILVTHISSTDGTRTTLVKGTDYTVSLNGDYKGGTVSVSYATSGWIELRLDVPYNQPVEYAAAGGLNLDGLEYMVDKVIQRMQLLDYVITHELGFPNYRGAWATSTYYEEGDIVYDSTNGVGMYICSFAHTSTTWSGNLASGVWELAFSQNDVAAFANLPTYTIADKGKQVVVDQLGAGYELTHHVPDPYVADEGTVPVVTQNSTGGYIYDSLQLLRSADPRLRFEYLSASAMKIYGRAVYYIDPASGNDIVGPVVCSDDGTTFTFTAISGTSYWQYVYLDMSGLTDRTFDYTDLYDSATAPSQGEYGWEHPTTGDPCLFAVWIGGSGNIQVFYHQDGGDFVEFDSQQTLRAYATLGSGWQQVSTASISPAFSSSIMASFLCGDATNQANYYRRVYGSSGTGLYLTTSTSSQVYGTAIQRVEESSSIFEVQSNQTTSSMGVFGLGFFLPQGM